MTKKPSLCLVLKHLNGNKKQNSLGMCARYVVNALIAGGHNVKHVPFAKMLNKNLEECGFVRVCINCTCNTHLAGDVVIFEGYKGQKVINNILPGHVAIFNGQSWVCDFVHQIDIWPGKTARIAKPNFAIYRYEY